MRIFNLLVLLFSICSNSYSQAPVLIAVDSLGNPIKSSSVRWMPDDEKQRLLSWRLRYKRPKAFREISGFECFKENPKLESVITCSWTQLKSYDEQFIAFIVINPIFSREDSIKMKTSFPGMNLPVLNHQHIYQVRAVLLYSQDKDASLYGENALFDWKQYVNYYSTEDSRRKFNADTAITFSFDLSEKDAYKSKYNHFKYLCLQKNDRGFVNIFCLYTKEAEKHLPKYWKAVEKIFRYDQ